MRTAAIAISSRCEASVQGMLATDAAGIGRTSAQAAQGGCRLEQSLQMRDQGGGYSRQQYGTTNGAMGVW